ncbi:MAG: electron transfer flavoprotein subunit alpha [Planctomycetota bacterium]|nr:MAG: electron transfer flavoprotein subunit alpha [Planctomycetota bacterium]
MAGEILVYVEQKGGAAKRASLEALTLGAKLAAARSSAAHAIVAGDSAADAAAECARYGAAKVLVLDTDPKDTHALAAAVAGVANDVALVLLAHTAKGKDLGPRIAGALNAPLASDCTAISNEGDTLVARRPVFAGKAIATVKPASGTLIASLRPNAVPAEESAADGAVENVSGAAPSTGLGAVLAEILAAADEKIALTEAAVVVSGGRGLKGPENFGMIEDLAAALGGAVGASRAVCDAGWRPHTEQVGQTGKVVSPNLYIAVAISGAIQHLAGMRTSNFIVAINSDAEAPIFKVADYGIVGDAFEIVPKLTEAVAALKAQG